MDSLSTQATIQNIERFELLTAQVRMIKHHAFIALAHTGNAKDDQFTAEQAKPSAIRMQYPVQHE